MRKIIFMMSVSLDGFMEGPNHELDWHLVDEELHAHFNDELGSMSAFLEGRVTYQLMEEFWPTADDDPASPPAIVEFARIWRDMPKIVYSKTLDRAGRKAEIVRAVDSDAVNDLKAQPGGNMALGGADLAVTFMRLDLVDEFRVYVHPVLIGRGRPMFHTSDERIDLQLTRTRAFGNGVVLLQYERRDQDVS